MGFGRLPAKNNPFRAACLANLATITIGTEGTNTINVAVQLKDANGVAIAEKCGIQAYLSDAATGLGITATAPSSGVAVGTNGLAIELITDKYFSITTDTSGRIDLTLSEAGVATWYLVLKMPDGTIIVSDAITFA